MKYSLMIDNQKVIPCIDQAENDVLYTATTLSKYGKCCVDVYCQKALICRYKHGKVIPIMNVA